MKKFRKIAAPLFDYVEIYLLLVSKLDTNVVSILNKEGKQTRLLLCVAILKGPVFGDVLGNMTGLWKILVIQILDFPCLELTQIRKRFMGTEHLCHVVSLEIVSVSSFLARADSRSEKAQSLYQLMTVPRSAGCSGARTSPARYNKVSWLQEHPDYISKRSTHSGRGKSFVRCPPMLGYL